MNQEPVPFDKLTALRFFRSFKEFAASDVGWRARLMFAALLALLLGINGANVLNSYVGRDFMTAIAQRNKSEFLFEALLYICVFAISTIVAVLSRFMEERLGLLWREFLTRRIVNIYLEGGTYYRLETGKELANPDQRIAEDIRSFTVTTLSFVLMLLNSGLTVIAFSGVLWSISPVLSGVAAIYAAIGSYVTIVLGRPLIRLNHDQLDKEADFRSALLNVRENAESIRLARREDRHRARLLSGLDNLVENFRKITSANRNVGFFTTGYNWVIQIIPALIVAPAFIDGKIEFGVITQSAMAFSLIVNAMSLIITQVQAISSVAPVVARLNSLVEAVERKQPAPELGIELVSDDERLAYEELTLLSAEEGQTILKNLSLSIPMGTRVLVSGSNEPGKAALFRATAGLSTAGKGLIRRPDDNNVYFLAERPYVPPGVLREVLLPPKPDGSIVDAQINALLNDLGLDELLARAGGLDAERDWGAFLSLGEQQLLSFTHVLLVKPRFVLLDRVSAALSADQVRKILTMLSKKSIAYVSIGELNGSEDLYDAILEIGERGDWTWRQLSATAN